MPRRDEGNRCPRRRRDPAVIQASELVPRDIDEVILVGGSEDRWRGVSERVWLLRSAVAVTVAVSIVCLPVGCDDDGGPQPLDFVVAMQKWESRGPSDYSFDYALTCFCGMLTWPIRVEVRGGEVVRATRAGTEDELSEEELAQLPTIDELFAMIAEAIEQDAAVIDATYDDELGYPVSVFIDWIKNAVDDEVSFTVTNVTALDSP